MAGNSKHIRKPSNRLSGTYTKKGPGRRHISSPKSRFSYPNSHF